MVNLRSLHLVSLSGSYAYLSGAIYSTDTCDFGSRSVALQPLHPQRSQEEHELADAPTGGESKIWLASLASGMNWWPITIL
jgi:hypothetical protein